MTWIPNEVLNQLKKISCEEVARKLGMNVKMHRTLCFMHSEHHPSLHFMGVDRISWFCFSCNKGGNAIDLVQTYNNIGFVEACLWLCNEFNINIETDQHVPKYNSRKKMVVHSISTKDTVKPFLKEVALFLIENSSLTDSARHFLFDERKLSPKVISDLNIVSLDDSRVVVNKLKENFAEQILVDSGLLKLTNGILYLCLFTPCLLIPYYNQKKELVGLQSRYLGTNTKAPRFQFISSHKSRIFNLPLLNSLKPKEELYISEGVTDCLALLSSGKKAVAIPSATILPKMDLSLLSNYKLVMIPDNDNAGEQAFVKLQRFFIDRYSFLKVERLPEGIKDYSEYYKKYHTELLKNNSK